MTEIERVDSSRESQTETSNSLTLIRIRCSLRARAETAEISGAKVKVSTNKTEMSGHIMK